MIFTFFHRVAPPPPPSVVRSQSYMCPVNIFTFRANAKYSDFKVKSLPSINRLYYCWNNAYLRLYCVVKCRKLFASKFLWLRFVLMTHEGTTIYLFTSPKTFFYFYTYFKLFQPLVNSTFPPQLNPHFRWSSYILKPWEHHLHTRMNLLRFIYPMITNKLKPLSLHVKSKMSTI